jgi:competence protein ComFC
MRDNEVMIFNLIEKILSLTVAVPHCSVCGHEGVEVCADCFDVSSEAKLSTCYRCNQLTDSFKTCRTCRSSSPLRQVFIGYRYVGLVRSLVLKAKLQPSISTARYCGDLLSNVLPKDNYLENCVITWVPASRDGKKARGFDQAEVAAKVLARRRGLKAVRLLERDRSDSSGRYLDNTTRSTRHKHSFKAVNVLPVSCSKIIIVDDVLTTGASLEACALALASRFKGVGVYGVVVAKGKL